MTFEAFNKQVTRQKQVARQLQWKAVAANVSEHSREKTYPRMCKSSDSQTSLLNYTEEFEV